MTSASEPAQEQDNADSDYEPERKGSNNSSRRGRGRRAKVEAASRIQVMQIAIEDVSPARQGSGQLPARQGSGQLPSSGQVSDQPMGSENEIEEPQAAQGNAVATDSDSREVTTWSLEPNKSGTFTLMLHTAKEKFQAEDVTTTDTLASNEYMQNLSVFLDKHTFWVQCKKSRGLYQLWDCMILCKSADFPEVSDDELRSKGFTENPEKPTLITPSAFAALSRDFSRRPYMAIKVVTTGQPLHTIRNIPMDWNLVPHGRPEGPMQPTMESPAYVHRSQKRRASADDASRHRSGRPPLPSRQNSLPDAQALDNSLHGHNSGHLGTRPSNGHESLQLFGPAAPPLAELAGNDELSTLLCASLTAASNCLKFCAELAAQHGQPLEHGLVGQDVRRCFTTVGDMLASAQAKKNGVALPVHGTAALKEGSETLTVEAHHLQRCAESLIKLLDGGPARV